MEHSNKVEPIRRTTTNKLSKQLKIALALAKINAYDAEGRIRDDNNKFLKNSDLVELLSQASTPGKVLIGEKQFLNLLKEARVDPDLISNDNMRTKLINLSKIASDSPPVLEPAETQIFTSYNRNRAPGWDTLD
jgi:hypothetical protein